VGESISATVRLKARATVRWTSRIDMVRAELAEIIDLSPSIEVRQGVPGT
jgi:hypothetical protein